VVSYQYEPPLSKAIVGGFDGAVDSAVFYNLHDNMTYLAKKPSNWQDNTKKEGNSARKSRMITTVKQSQSQKIAHHYPM